MNRNILRLGAKTIVPNILRTVTSFLGGLTASWLVLHAGSRELLNSYVQLVLIQALAIQLLGWGMRDYLFKAFGADPSGIQRTVGAALAAKGILLVPVVLVVLLAPGSKYVPVMLAWVVVRAALQTFEPLVNFRRSYGFAAALDLVGIALFAAIFLLPGQRTLIVAMAANLCSDGMKLSAYLVRFRRDRPRWVGFAAALRFLRTTFPFFLVAVAGYFVMRVDVYSMGFFAHRKEVGQYHVLVNFLQAMTLVLGAIPGAYAVTLLRAPAAIFRRASAAFVLNGIPIAAVGVVVIRLAMEYLYGLRMDWLQMFIVGLFAVGFLLTLRSFFGITRGYSQGLTTLAVLGGGATNFGLSLMLIPRHGVTGALLASASGQWGTFLTSVLLVWNHDRIRHHRHP
jgi:O-antigen/teichoic acid export membrane protein